jgi:hypothetical protein
MDYDNIEAWCDCREGEEQQKCFDNAEFIPDGRCKCGIYKHHYHGGTCGKVVQVG